VALADLALAAAEEGRSSMGAEQNAKSRETAARAWSCKPSRRVGVR